MEKLHYRISLDMFDTVSQKIIKAKKGDTACDIIITLTENGKVYQITEGCYAIFSAKKPDGNPIYNSETCSIEGNTITYGFTDQTTACEGMVECEVILCDEDGNRLLTSPRFSLLVGGTVYNGEEIVDSAPEADALKELIGEATDVINDGRNLITDANAYADEIANQKKSEAVHDSIFYTDEKIAEANEKFNKLESNIFDVNDDLREQKMDSNEAKESFANAIKGNESGYVVALNDVSPIEHNVKVKVKRKNLAVYPYDGSYESHGVTWTDNGDGTVNAVGTSSGYSQFWLTTTCPFEDGKTYTWTTHSPIELVLLYTDATGVGKTAHGSIVWSDRFTFKRMYLQVLKDNIFDSATAYPILVEGTTIDYYWEPYIADLTQVNVEVLGKNVLPPWTDTSYETNGITFSRGEDGTIIINGTSTGFAVVQLPKPSFKHGISYTISMPRSKSSSFGNGGLMVNIVDKDGNSTLYKDLDGRRVFTWDRENTLKAVAIQIEGGKTFDNVIVYPQIEIGKTVTDYEPYIKPIQFAPNSDGTLELNSLECSEKTLQVGDYRASIEAEYNIDTKKYIDRKFAELQALVLEV